MSKGDALRCLLAFVFVVVIIGAAVMGVSPRKIFALMISGVFLAVLVGGGAECKDDSFW